MGLQCGRCKKRLFKISNYVYKSGKDKMTHLGVCIDCYNKARSLKVPKLER